MHEPDPVTPIEETLAALDDLVRAGKVRYVGSSNFAAWQVVEAEWVARVDGVTRFVSRRTATPCWRRSAEAELVPACEQYGIGLIPYFPLESGLLSGKYSRGQQAPRGYPAGPRALPAHLEDAPWDTIERLTRSPPIATPRCSTSPSAASSRSQGCRQRHRRRDERRPGEGECRGSALGADGGRPRQLDELTESKVES